MDMESENDWEAEKVFWADKLTMWFA